MATTDEARKQFRALFEEHEGLMLFVLDIFKEQFPICKLRIFCKVRS